MLSYREFTPQERRAIVEALKKHRDELGMLINQVSVDSFEIVLSPAEARKVAELVRPYYMPVAHKLEDHPGYEPDGKLYP